MKQTPNPLAQSKIKRPIKSKSITDLDLATIKSNLINRKIDPKQIPQLFPEYLAQCETIGTMPSQDNFALFLGISGSNLSLLADKYETIGQVIDYLQTVRADKLVQGSLTGKLNANFAQFLLKTKHGYSETNSNPNTLIQNNWFKLDDRGYDALNEIIKKPEVK